MMFVFVVSLIYRALVSLVQRNLAAGAFQYTSVD